MSTCGCSSCTSALDSLPESEKQSDQQHVWLMDGVVSTAGRFWRYFAISVLFSRTIVAVGTGLLPNEAGAGPRACTPCHLLAVAAPADHAVFICTACSDMHTVGCRARTSRLREPVDAVGDPPPVFLMSAFGATQQQTYHHLNDMAALYLIVIWCIAR